MRIGIFGGNSQIATDFMREVTLRGEFQVMGFVRDGAVVSSNIASSSLVSFATYDALGASGKFDLLINCIGTGSPSKVGNGGGSALQTSEYFDALALDLVLSGQTEKYIFLSSGVAYGVDFSQPAIKGQLPLDIFNRAIPGDSYGLAKFQAEARHRQLGSSHIYDLRVFGYVDSTLNENNGYLFTQVKKSIATGVPLETSSREISRDYITSKDFYALVAGIARDPGSNLALDCYSASAVTKFELFDHLVDEFGFKYDIVAGNKFDSPTGLKPNYFSLNDTASKFGYKPKTTALENFVSALRN